MKQWFSNLMYNKLRIRVAMTKQRLYDEQARIEWNLNQDQNEAQD